MPKAEEQHVEIGRLALRVEGDWWNAYYAMTDTMNDALLLGSIRFTLAQSSGRVKDAFVDLMRTVVADILEDVSGQRPTWSGIQRAPEHEKSGKA